MGISTTLYTPPITHGQYGSSRYTGGEERLNLIPWRYIPGFTIPSSASSSYTRPSSHTTGTSSSTYENRPSVIPYRYFPGYTSSLDQSSSYSHQSTRPSYYSQSTTADRYSPSTNADDKSFVIPSRCIPGYKSAPGWGSFYTQSSSQTTPSSYMGWSRDVSIQNAYNRVIDQLDNSEESYWIEDIVTQSAETYKTDKVGALKMISGLISILDEHQVSDFDSVRASLESLYDVILQSV